MADNESLPEGKLFRRWKFSFFCVITFAVINSSLYSSIAKATLHRAQIDTLLRLPLESRIPFEPLFVWAYISFWLLLILPFWIYSMPKQFKVTKILIRFFRQKLGLKGQISWFFANLGIKFFGLIEDLTRFIFGEEDDEKVIRKARVQTFLAYLIVAIVSSATYWFMPLVVPRNHISIEKIPGLTIKMLAFVWRSDLPDNTFPSQHASFSFLTFFIFNHLRAKPGWSESVFKLTKKKSIKRRISVVGLIFLIWAILIVLSTFFVKQHIIADAAAGMTLSYVAFKVGFSDKLYGWLSRAAKKVTAVFKKVFHLPE
ncbi:MAG: phosphatase PAP2 family protein [Patescibacteria group bacterium]|nr:phosphatase PAP2 family protein [Patescibacteria group bacterium]